MNTERIRRLFVEEDDVESTAEGRVEELVGGVDDAGERSARERYYRKIDASILASARVAWDDWRTKFGSLAILFFLFMVFVWEGMYRTAYRYSADPLVRPFNDEYTHQILAIEEIQVAGITLLEVNFGGFDVWQYPLGTNQFGQDILQRIVNASPAMAKLVLAGAVISVGIAVIIGTVAGYKGGTVDDVLMVLTDVVLTIPGLPLTLMLAAVFRPKDPFILGMILAIDNWPGLARSIRSQVLTTRNESYVEASRAMGVPLGGILSKDIVPPLMPYIFINAARAGKSVINQAVALYFLGFLASDAANWGRMMDRAYRYGALTDLSQFYLILWPMLVLALLSFSLVLLAQGLDKISNPRLRARHAKTVDDEDELTSEQ